MAAKQNHLHIMQIELSSSKKLLGFNGPLIRLSP